MELKPGYKQTEVGVIPEDWEVKSIDELIDRARLGGNYPNSERETSCPLIKMGNMGRGEIVTSKLEYVHETFPIDAQHLLQAGDVLFNTRNTLDLVGKVCVWRDELSIAYYNSNILRLDFSKDQISSSYFVNYALNSYRSIRGLREIATGTTSVAAIYTRDFLVFKIAKPTFPEQTAIATALSDVDALLTGLDKLIAKKRAIKTAAMQQLLTGQTRLPGFEGEWEVKLLGDVLTMRHGRSQHEVVVTGGKYPILASGGEIGRTDSFLYDKPSVLIGRKGTIDEPQFISSPFWTVDTLFYTEMERGTDAKFVFYKFCMIPWRSYNEASGVPSINARTIENIEIRLPNIQEQTAITAILTDMDAEITALETRCVKTQSLKQGMMQELLTGRTRLL